MAGARTSYSHVSYRQQVEALMTQLGQGVEEMYNSEKWREALDFLSRFHTYSWFNALLIGMQRSGATHVAGFNTWKGTGRYVRRGEKAIKILAPRFGKQTDPKTGAEEDVVVGFIPVSVFDVSQTEGPPLPAIPSLVPITGNSRAARSLYERLKKIIPIPVEERELGQADGQFDPLLGCIAIRESLPWNARVVALVHEYAHYLMHDGPANRFKERRYEEAIAEGIAYIVVRHFGIDPGQQSFEYIAEWSRERGLVWTVGPQIQRTATFIIGQIQDAARRRSRRLPMPPPAEIAGTQTRPRDVTNKRRSAPPAQETAKWVTVVVEPSHEGLDGYTILFGLHRIPCRVGSANGDFTLEVPASSLSKARKVLRTGDSLMGFEQFDLEWE